MPTAAASRPWPAPTPTRSRSTPSSTRAEAAPICATCACSLPPGMLINPANAVGVLCSQSSFTTPRSSPFATESGENCNERAQVGTVRGAERDRRRQDPHLRPLQPAAQLRRGGALRRLAVRQIAGLRREDQLRRSRRLRRPGRRAKSPRACSYRSAEVSLWGAPWDASHNAERGDCLNEAEPGFACQMLGRGARNQQAAGLRHPADRLRVLAHLQGRGQLLAAGRDRESHGDLGRAGHRL